MDLSTRQGRREQGQLIQKAIDQTAGLSVEELANKIGCSRALIYQYLSGTTLAQPDRLQQIASITGVTLPYFFGADAKDEGRKGKRSAEDTQARISEMLRQLEELARAYECPTDWNALASTAERIISLAGQAYDSRAEAGAHLRLGKARIHTGDYSRAGESLGRAASLFASLGDERKEADSRQALGNALLANGRIEEAREQFDWVAKSEDWEARWCGQVSLAAVDEHLGDYRRAMERCDDAAVILEEAGDRPEAASGTLYVNANRVNLYLACGDYGNAVPLAEKCLSDAESSGNSDQYIEARLNLGVCCIYQGRWALGNRTLSAAISLARFVGDRGREAIARATFALMLASMGDYENSTLHAKDALAAGLSQGDHRTELFAQMALADAYLRMDRLREARYHANQALAVATSLRLPLYQADARLRMARVSLKSHELVEALDHAERALSNANSLGARHIAAQARVISGDWKLRNNDVEGAAREASQAAEIARELGCPPIEWEALALKARVECSYDPPHDADADSAASRAVELIEGVRLDLQNGGLPDTVLEDADREDIYLFRAKLLADSRGPAAAHEFVRQIGWPPIANKFHVS